MRYNGVSMKIAIVGYGKEGQSAYNYWQSDTNQLTICDQNLYVHLPDDVQGQLGLEYLHGLDQFDLIVRSPSVHPRDIVKANSETILSKVTTVTNEFFRVCPSKNIIGVSGTKGKGTTSTLIAKILEANGKKVHLGGNIGIPTLDLLIDHINPSDYVVLELSNFQLVDLNYSPHIAVCLIVVPEHLNWHTDMAEYIAAKQHLFSHQQPSDIAIYFADNDISRQIASSSAGQTIPYFAEPGALVKDGYVTIDGHSLCRTAELQLLGRHNWQNVCAAVTAAWQISHDVESIRQLLINFTGLEHRLEFVREVEGVKFYNDSFASAPDAAIAAMEAVSGSKIMIMGGFDRHLPLEHLAKATKSHEAELRKVILIGESAERLAKEFSKACFNNFEITTAQDLSVIIAKARSFAQKGDSVVLSPGFASFDMFKNFEDRGQQYKAVVEQL
jgi:UDP-N-acetylmuramoylalanine--D-glutamate ligase